MKSLFKLKALAAILAVGATIPSCGTDFRDALLTGMIDGVSGTVAESVRAAVPLPEWISLIAPLPNSEAE